MTAHAPIPDYAAARASMIDTQLRPEGVNFPPVVEAMAAVAREDFVALEARPLAYIDRTVLLNGPPREVLATGIASQLFPTLNLAPREAVRA